ncbi:MAG: hypothetical protein M1816_005263 [Peltula sp. TS41687]|nr:MAG: hypothetical protein M1816_005263 [Peltula sp. TS41687]
MSSSSQQPSKTSRWGSLLQQAVAGVESRLDTILTDAAAADGGPAPAASSKAPAKAPPETIAAQQPSLRRETVISATPSSLKVDDGRARTRSNSRTTNDRLQERLARAMVGKDNARTGRSPAPSSSGMASRTSSPALSTLSYDGEGSGSPRRRGGEGKAGGDLDDAIDGPMPGEMAPNGHLVKPGEESGLEEAEVRPRLKDQQQHLLVLPASGNNEAPAPHARLTIDASGASGTPQSRRSQESARASGGEDDGQDSHERNVKTAEEYEAILAQLRSDYEMAEMRRQDEVHTYTERIDALQAKLKLLSRETADSARHATATAIKGSLEGRLAERDEQIAGLMDEGLKLAETELKNMNTIKKLRASVNEKEKALSEAQRRLEKTEKGATEAREKARRAETSEKRANDRLRNHARLEKEVEALKAERDANNSVVASLKAQLAQSSAKASEDDRIALEAERKVVVELREGLSKAKVEKELAGEKARAEVRGLKEKAEREKERHKIAEMELRHEQSMLETKMEALRARAEEVTMGATGDAQAKLFRQIETLQTQYAVSSENWQRIEESLMTRLTGLEKEREDFARREQDLRHKAREFNTKAKRTQEELDKSIDRLHSLEQDLTERDAQLDTLREKANQLEGALMNARRDFDREKQSWELDFLQRMEQEKMKWREDTTTPNPASFPQSRTESPVNYGRKASNSDFYTLQQSRRTRGGQAPASAEMLSGSLHDSSLSDQRRPSLQPPRTPELGSLSRQDSLAQIQMQMPPHTPTNGGGMPQTPSIHAPDPDELFESHSVSHRTVNDMISASTVGAGPSVQLVERMSAGVRRLESEKAALKDELARLTGQRDEAREEVLTLMREIEQKHEVDEKVRRLQAEVAEINERYQTTLEMLGEKSEQVEELRADVADMKSIYRDLLDKTMK